MEVEWTKHFIKDYKKLDSKYKKRIDKTLLLLINDFSHPSLRVKKMKGYTNPNIWEASANMDLRITFEIEKPDTIFLRSCGHHDETLKNP